MSDLFIASRAAVPRDDSRRTVMAGAFIGDVLHVKGPVEGADALAMAVMAGRRERELGIEAARRPGHRAWEQREDTP